MLFDDLPEVKGSSAKSDTVTDDRKADACKSDAGDDKARDIGSRDIPTCDAKSQSQSSERVAPKKKKSLVDSLGSAGTKMAFLPAALRKRKAVVAPNRGSQQTRRRNLGNEEAVTEIHKTEKDGGNDSNRGVHLIPNHEAEKVYTKAVADLEYRESQKLTNLHAAVHPTDMYNPMMPNDYLAYRQRKENEIMQADFERQAKKTMEMQKKLRDQIEEERQKALATGDFDKIIESRILNAGIGGSNNRIGVSSVGRGRGRGRGMSNLPAWLVNKKQRETE